MKHVSILVCLLALMIGSASADNLFFKVVDGDSPGVNVTGALIAVCVTDKASAQGTFSAGGGNGGGGGGGGGAGGSGDTIPASSSSSAMTGCLTDTTDYLGEASFNIEYNGVDEMNLYYHVLRTGYKNATGSVSMNIIGLPSSRLYARDPFDSFVIKEINLDLTWWVMHTNPRLMAERFRACPSGKCAYTSQQINVSMQQTGNVFRLRWGDIFPACAADYSGSVDTVRCAAEFLVPNLHLQSYVSLTWQMFLSIFRVELSIQGLFDWILGIITPLLIMALIFVYEVVKTYLLFALTYLSWTTLISVLVRKNIISGPVLAWLIPASIVVIFLGSIWLIGSDINLWKPLLIW
jgi:hypothetical protein